MFKKLIKKLIIKYQIIIIIFFRITFLIEKGLNNKTIVFINRIK